MGLIPNPNVMRNITKIFYVFLMLKLPNMKSDVGSLKFYFLAYPIRMGMGQASLA
jgi:hypothetical protein